MAALPSSYVTILKSWTEGDVTGKRGIARKVKISIPAADTGAYGDPTTSPIPVSVFNLSVLEDVSAFYSPFNGAPRLVVASAGDGTKMLTIDVNQPTDANRANSAGALVRASVGVAGDYYGVVRGY